MKLATVERIDTATLPEREAHALLILANLPVEDVNQIKEMLHLGDPGIVGPTTLESFLKMCSDPPLKFDLSTAGVNVFKDSQHLGNSGAMRGVIGPQTAAFYFEQIMQALGSNGSAGVRQINAAGLDLIKEFEGYFKLIPGTTNVTTYLDPVNVPTIGYGHTGPDVTMGLVITQDQAEALLRRDLADAERGVAQLVTVPLNDNEFAALVSFTFNLGADTLANSTLLHLLNAGQRAEAADQFLRFRFADGQELPGLVRRREAERALFLTG
jgi:GH24 family phage-related lysozyme (muramidase)